MWLLIAASSATELSTVLHGRSPLRLQCAGRDWLLSVVFALSKAHLATRRDRLLAAGRGCPDLGPAAKRRPIALSPCSSYVHGEGFQLRADSSPLVCPLGSSRTRNNLQLPLTLILLGSGYGTLTRKASASVAGCQEVQSGALSEAPSCHGRKRAVGMTCSSPSLRRDAPEISCALVCST